MSLTFQQRMAEATRLTRGGDLQAATAAIQAALAGAEAGRGHHLGPVIDIEAREVDDDRPVAEPVGPGAERFIAGSHGGAAGTRGYKLFLPPDDAGPLRPLVVMLHGCTQTPDDFAAGTRMNDAALERRCLVLYPAQAQSMNPSRCWNWFKHSHQRRGRGEAALLAGMTAAVVERHRVDPDRIYVAGLSAGGAMAAILGDAYPDVFAAVGVHSGLPAGCAVDLPSALAAMKDGARTVPTGRAPPTIVFHGDRDATVHPANGESVVAATAGGAMPEIERAQSIHGRAYTRRIYRDADDMVVAEHWAVHGAGHAWSGGDPRGSYTDAHGPDATREMLRFFFEHTLARRRPP